MFQNNSLFTISLQLSIGNEVGMNEEKVGG